MIRDAHSGTVNLKSKAWPEPQLEVHSGAEMQLRQEQETTPIYFNTKLYERGNWWSIENTLFNNNTNPQDATQTTALTSAEHKGGVPYMDISSEKNHDKHNIDAFSVVACILVMYY